MYDTIHKLSMRLIEEIKKELHNPGFNGIDFYKMDEMIRKAVLEDINIPVLTNIALTAENKRLHKLIKETAETMLDEIGEVE